tara:strand:+ start:89 stop:1237 length:1149 start_codon:yes stop_codon:yes gene_type:complete
MAKNTKISKIKETEETVSGTTDLTSDVTGVLPVGNGGTGLTSISTLLNSNVTTISGNAGTATKLATQRDLQVDLSDSGAGGFDGSGNTLDIGVGSSVLGVTNGGTGLTSISTLLNSNTTKSDVGLGNVENKSSATIRGEIVAGDIPTLNQNTTGSAASLTTERNLQVDLSSTSSDGFDGSGNATDIGVKNTLAVANGGTGVTSLSSLYAYQYLNWEVNTNSFTGTNYEWPAANGGFGSDSFTINTGVARDTAIDGTVSITANANLQMMGWFVPHACKLIGVSGSFRNNGGESNPRDVAIFVGTPDIGTSNTSSYVQRLFAAGDDDGGSSNSKMYKVNTTLSTPFDLVAGNIVMPAVCNSTGSSTVSMQGNFAIIIATPIFTI